MSKESGPGPIQVDTQSVPESSEGQTPFDPYRANREFERWMMQSDPSFRIDAPRSDQRGYDSPCDYPSFPDSSTQEGEVVMTINYDFQKETISYNRPGGDNDGS